MNCKFDDGKTCKALVIKNLCGVSVLPHGRAGCTKENHTR